MSNINIAIFFGGGDVKPVHVDLQLAPLISK